MENSFGKKIKELREEQKLLLREVAAKLNIDPSLLSKIENNNRSAKKELIKELAKFFNVNYQDLLISWFSDKIVDDLRGEKNIEEILRIAEEKIKNGKK